MFGGQNQIASSWGQQQQQPQQQQPPSAFGQPASTFGSTNTFGSGGAFGQPQQQQPQANPMFGGLGGTSTTPAAPASGFGAFGGSNTATPGNSLFGAPKPATGFGAFGGAAAGTSAGTFGGGGAFGTTPAATTSTGLFGGAQPTGSSSAFGGTGSSLFGAKPAAGFGTTAATAATGNYDGVPPVTTGTSNPPYSVFSEKDPSSASVTLQYNSITCMPAYRGTSFEELRLQDYQQGRKTAGAFGQQSFSTPAAATGSGLFGQAPTTSSQPANSMFGNFGTSAPATSTTGTAGFGAFNQPANPTPAAGNSMFGATGAFGAQQQQPQPQPQPQQQQQAAGAFGTFGQQQPQQQPQQAGATGGLFGGGAFGGNQSKPFGSFGTTGTNSGAFGAGTGAFNAQPQQQQGATPGTGLFGAQQTQPQQSTGAFGTFGTTAQKPSLFAQPTQPAGSTAFGFGGQQQGQPQQPTQPTGGLFGGGNLFGGQQQQQTAQPTGGLFGAQQPQPQQPAAGLFGNTGNTGGGLFGNTNTSQQTGQQQPGQTNAFGLFGQQKPATNTPAGGGLFGTFGQNMNPGTAQTQQQTTGLFGGSLGQTASTQQTAFGAGGGLFGNKSTTPVGQQPIQQTGNLFGGGAGTGLFNSTLGGSALGQSQPQPMLTASIAQPISANLPIFNILPPGPRAVTLDPPKKKPSLFRDVPTRSPVPRLQLGYTPAASRLRGFTSTTMIPGQDGRPLGPAVSLTSGRPGVLSLSKANKSFLGPDSLLASTGANPGLGSGQRQSVKKLILDKKVEPSDIFSKAPSKINWNPALGIAAREAEAAQAAAASSQEATSPVSKAPAPRKSNRFSAQVEPSKETAAESEPELQEGDYYVRPPLSDLKKRSFKELAAVKNLVVGRVGYGEIIFLDPVDLTGLNRTSELMGDIIRFEDKECCVYPDIDEADKPPRGTGLNVRARITLLHCWPLDKAKREPIKDETHPSMIKHIKRLSTMKNTHFIGYNVEDGTWEFTVDNF